MIFFIEDLQNEPKWRVQLADFEILNIVLLLNFIFVSENHITVVAVIGRLHYVI